LRERGRERERKREREREREYLGFEIRDWKEGKEVGAWKKVETSD
jgi:hypothetical protein